MASEQIFDMMDSKARADCIKEIDLLKSLNHPNIIQYLASFIANNEVRAACFLNATVVDVYAMVNSSTSSWS